MTDKTDLRNKVTIYRRMQLGSVWGDIPIFYLVEQLNNLTIKVKVKKHPVNISS